MINKVSFSDIEKIVERIGKARHNLIPCLQEIQANFSYISEEAIKTLSSITSIPVSEILGVASFYPGFRMVPSGRYNIKICVGTACHIKGSELLYDEIKKYLNIAEREDTDTNMNFTVSKVACLGCCMLAPAIQIGDIVYGPVLTSDISSVLKDFLDSDSLSGSSSCNNEDNTKKHPSSIKLCMCSSCRAAGSFKLFKEIGCIIDVQGLEVSLHEVNCSGQSGLAPLLEITQENGKVFRYGRVSIDNIRKILGQHFKSKKIICRIDNILYKTIDKLYGVNDSKLPNRYFSGVRDPEIGDTHKQQYRITTEGAGNQGPLDFDQFCSAGGFKAYFSCLQSKDKKKYLDELISSGLRGRGGAGYSTGLKWTRVSSGVIKEKYLICNADEGDPGAFMDRMLLESFPFRVIEGILIAASLCDIKKAYIFLRSEYSLAVERIRNALEICSSRSIFSRIGLDIQILTSAGAFICGEETAMISSIHGLRAHPSLRPPYPSEKGLWGKPTLINNVETFAAVPWIIKNGAQSFKSIGTSKSTGTKTFALAGKIKNGGLIEVQMGSLIKDIIDVGGGPDKHKKIKAVQIGGPSGGILPYTYFDTPVDYEALTEKGIIMGSGGIIVLDEEDCIVDIAKYFISFAVDESCGKCSFCRVGTMRMFEMLEKLGSGDAGTELLEDLEILAIQVKQSSLCGLGRSAPNPVLSGLRYFREEFMEHTRGRCPAKKCQKLITYSISDKCIGCTRCAQNCPEQAIEPYPYHRHKIDLEKCTRCGTCRKICPSGAVIVDT